ncbi:MAG: glutamate-5-semialdehyde dehydrogenase [Bacilli bacterium]
MKNQLKEIGLKAKKASESLVLLDQVKSNEVLLELAQLIDLKRDAIINANALDVKDSIQKEVALNIIDRLTLNQARIDGLISNLKQVAQLKSPLNQVIESFVSSQGFIVNKERVPLGVVAIIFEARPNVCIEALALCLKSGNATILRGSTSCLNTNIILVELAQEAALNCGIDPNFVQLVQARDRSDIKELVRMNEYLDVVIPRGGKGLIEHVINHATVPIIETGMGNNYAYIEKSANLEEAIKVIINAKTSRTSVCNSLEKLLINKNIAKEFYHMLNEALIEKEVLVKACTESQILFTNCEAFKDEDYEIEYLSNTLGIKIVSDIYEAISLINKYSTKHSNIILSNNYDNINLFTKRIDAACVYVNVSSRFSDGEQFGLGAEIGISTQKLHYRGPMGLEALTTTKSIITGSYNIRE